MRLLAVLLIALSSAAHAQFQILDGKTIASLRGIDAVSPQVAWASGSGGTVLLTTDGGANWKHCTVPPGGEKLDFRGVQGVDATTAVIMSSGKGDLSKLYKTTDACQTWVLLFTNPDADGFWDGFVMANNHSEGLVVGDQVNGKFAMFAAPFALNSGWQRFEYTVTSPKLNVTVPRSKEEVMFAASNSILSGDPGGLAFVTGGKDGSFLHATKWHRNPLVADWWSSSFSIVSIPLAKGASAGAFSFATRSGCPSNNICAFVVVGGDYMKPNDTTGTAAYGSVSKQSEVPDRFTVSETPPGGYRSSVAYDSGKALWIAVGPNGTDISHDDGKNWMPLKPSANDSPDTDKNWNAISMPFVVGSKGKIGKLEKGIPAK